MELTTEVTEFAEEKQKALYLAISEVTRTYDKRDPQIELISVNSVSSVVILIDGQLLLRRSYGEKDT